jgi:Fur family transcriptional regulator, peroxide stress response regulator
MTAPAHEAPPDVLRTALETSGWRCTPQRTAVYSQLCRIDHHPTAEEVYLGVRDAIPNISLATVYKSLEALVSCGLVTKLSAGDGSARYDARCDHHYHLRDLRTGVVHDLPTNYDPALVEKLDADLSRWLSEHGFQVTGYRLELLGHFVKPASRPVTIHEECQE